MLVPNEIIANLTFEKSVIHIVEAECNMETVPKDTAKIGGLDIKYSHPVVIGNKKHGGLLMQVEVSVNNPEEGKSDDKIKIVLEGFFSSKADIEDAVFVDLLNINGGAALYSIARSKIEMLSSMIYAEGKIVLPMINILQYYEEKNKKKSEA